MVTNLYSQAPVLSSQWLSHTLTTMNLVPRYRLSWATMVAYADPNGTIMVLKIRISKSYGLEP